MLVLGSATFTIDGVTIFKDHADPDQFWYLAAPVTLARRPIDQRASFTFIKYKPKAVEAGKGGGFLLFTTEVKLTPGSILETKIIAEITSKTGSRTPKLAAVAFDSGTVQCVALDLQGSGGTSNPAPAGAFKAVQKILGATTPSLSGDNNALFSLALTPEGATIIDQAFGQGAQPVGVIYDLKYTALRPALKVKITADYKRVYNQFKASLEGQYYFFNASLEAQFEFLKQTGAIKIEVIDFTGAADREDKEKWALEFFRDKLMTDWFTPTLVPGEVRGGATPASPATPGSIPTTSTVASAIGSAVGGAVGGTPSAAAGSSTGTAVASAVRGGTPTSTPAAGSPNPATSSATSSSTTSSSTSTFPSTVTPAAQQTPSTSKPATATLEVTRRDPDPTPNTFGIDFTPATTGTAERIIIRGANPKVEVNDSLTNVAADGSINIDLPANSSRRIRVHFPGQPTPETFHLRFAFDQPPASPSNQLEVTPAIMSAYQSGSPANDPVFASDGLHELERNGAVTGLAPGGNGSAALRQWVKLQVIAGTVLTFQGRASFEGRIAADPHNMKLSTRRRKIAEQIVRSANGSVGAGQDVGDNADEADPTPPNPNPRLRETTILGQVLGSLVIIEATITRGADVVTPGISINPDKPKEPEKDTDATKPKPPELPKEIPGAPQIALKLKFIHQDEQKIVTFEYDRQEAVQRTYAPQGLIGLLTTDLERRAPHFIEVDLDDAFFHTLQIEVKPPLGTERIGLASSSVSIDYGPIGAPDSRRRQVRFNAPNLNQQLVEFFLNTRKDTNFQYTASFSFEPDSGWLGSKDEYTQGPVPSNSRVIQLDPRKIVGFLEVEVLPGDIDPNLVELIEARLKYPAARPADFTSTFIVRPGAAPQSWKLRLDTPVIQTYSAQLIHHLKDGTIRTGIAIEQHASKLFVHDPFTDALELIFIPRLDPASVLQAFIDVEYTDPANNFVRRERREITGPFFENSRIRISIIDPTLRSFKHKITLITTQGLIQKPTITTDNTFIEIST